MIDMYLQKAIDQMNYIKKEMKSELEENQKQNGINDPETIKKEIKYKGFEWCFDLFLDKISEEYNRTL